MAIRIIDLETTGIDSTDHVVEVGSVDLLSDGSIGRYQEYLIKPPCLFLPKIISGRIGDAAQPRSEWRQWRQIVGRLDARGHLSVMPSACAPDCNTPHTKQELAAGVPRRRSVFGPGTRDARFRSGVPRTHFATVTGVRSAGPEYPSPSPGT